MRFISQAMRMSVQIQAGRSEYLAGGVERPIIPNIVAEFESHDVTDDEVAFAEKNFSGINGRKYLQDEVTPEPLRNRMSCFDTELESRIDYWSSLDEQFNKEPGYHKQLVEDKLLSRSGPSTDILLFVGRQASAPWPRYNDFAGSFEDLVQRVVDDGYDLAEVALYESQHLNRPEVLELLEMVQRDKAESDQAAIDRGEYIPA